MTEPQFTYGAFTLDELRSLAASPQVGTMQAMPASFRALADRVGEVADLLSHAQADLPNWWKGTAAEQAAATLGHAAAEAREFHDSAMGAATAVSRCAQVVAEQQSQMMNVPDLPEPGITAVVQRPKTPLDALEAARQDARYQAAHEQAVQVVNGIAAQYVETHTQLSTISTPRGEDFTSSLAPNMAAPYAAGELTIGPPAPLQFEGSNRVKLEDRQRQRQKSLTESPGRATNYNIPTQIPTQSNTLYSAAKADEIDPPSLSRKVTTPTSTAHLQETTATKPWSADMLPTAEETHGLEPREPAASNATSHKEEPQISAHDSGTYDLTNTHLAYNRHDQQFETYPAKDSLDATRFRSQAAIETNRKNLPPAHDDPLAQKQPQLGYPAKADTLTDNTSSSIFPPYVSPSSVRQAGENRNQRPRYLTERKSVWLPDKLAAPADGVIAPDFFEQP